MATIPLLNIVGEFLFFKISSLLLLLPLLSLLLFIHFNYFVYFTFRLINFIFNLILIILNFFSIFLFIFSHFCEYLLSHYYCYFVFSLFSYIQQKPLLLFQCLLKSVTTFCLISITKIAEFSAIEPVRFCYCITFNNQNFLQSTYFLCQFCSHLFKLFMTKLLLYNALKEKKRKIYKYKFQFIKIIKM